MAYFNEIDTAGPDDRICGVVTGLVKENYDKDHEGMVKVEYMLGENGKNVTGWVPVASPYACKESGVYLLPEVGAEVLITFLLGDRNRPVVIGSLWNKVNTMPKESADKDNKNKLFRTKGGTQITIVDVKDKETVEVKTPKEISLKIDDEKETVMILDKGKKNGVQIEMKDGKITLLCDKEMTFKVGNKPMITMDGKTIDLKGDDIKVTATKGITLKGQNIKADGTQTDIEGKSGLNVKSSAIVQVKGSMVKIN